MVPLCWWDRAEPSGSRIGDPARVQVTFVPPRSRSWILQQALGSLSRDRSTLCPAEGHRGVVGWGTLGSSGLEMLKSRAAR